MAGVTELILRTREQGSVALTCEQDRCVCDLGAEAEDNASLYWKRVASALPGGMEDIFGFAFSGEEVRRHREEGAWDRNRLGRR